MTVDRKRRALSDRVPEPARALLRAIGWHRRWLAAGCAAMCVAFGFTADVSST